MSYDGTVQLEELLVSSVSMVENAYRYYDRLFPDNPFIKIGKWVEAQSIIKNWEENQVKKKQEECSNWWSSYKIDLQEMIKNKITS